MAAKFDQNDDSVVVIVGSGSGGGTLGNELAQKGVKVVVLEAGKRYEYEDFINDEWPSFTQLAWKDMRTTSGDWRVHKDFPHLPAWIVKAVGGTSIHWAGASLRLQEHEFKDAHDLRPHPRRQSSRLAADPGRARALLRQGRGQDGGHPHQRHPGPAGQQQFQGLQGGRRQARLQGVPHRPNGDQFRRARRPQFLPADRILFPGLQVGREMVDALHRDSQGRGDRQPGGSPGVACRADRARFLGQGHRRHLFRRGREAATSEGAHRRGRGQFAREPASSAQLGLGEVS